MTQNQSTTTRNVELKGTNKPKLTYISALGHSSSPPPYLPHVEAASIVVQEKDHANYQYPSP